MGSDKALLVVDGQPMVRRVAGAARSAGAATVVTVGGDDAALRGALAGLGIPALADAHPGEGPLGGLLTALDRLGGEAVLVVSCDLLAPDAGTMAATVAALDPRPPASAAAADVVAVPDVAVPEVAGRVQWLHAAWRRHPDVLRRLEERFAAGERSIHRAVAQARLTVAPVPGTDPAALADADTPEDLRRAAGPPSGISWSWH
jgi:molybdopterin-guanine dinucleotide biosynthesis protein A